MSLLGIIFDESVLLNSWQGVGLLGMFPISAQPSRSEMIGWVYNLKIKIKG
jgi:hypothetical protein